ncbi:GH25 family lysozyme [Paraburkholderia sp. C35]|uniref:GH25 family lysozyme n=1 Tax=Paraburkholderia sp. C35 TaxID=2126993 RepID=UPI0013A5364F|nr:GH25 family lysozyme [Paraburkholderia sp. C35]
MRVHQGKFRVTRSLHRALVLAMALAFPAVAVYANPSVKCDKGVKGAYVDKVERCAFFRKFAPRDGQVTDPRILSAYGDDTQPVRSIAIVAGVSKYRSTFVDGDLPAAHADVDRLQKFLTGNQGFDEVIVLENDAATQEAIHYFLTGYVVSEANAYSGRVRVLFAFSGHGVQDTAGSALALASATTASDESGLYRLTNLQSDLQIAAGASWQILGLVDACYGGDIFGTGYEGGNPDAYWEPGAHVVTAGSAGSLTWTVGDKQGSVFFKALMDGIENGSANSFPVQARDPTNPAVVHDYGSVITQNQAVGEATRVIHNVQLGLIPTNFDKTKISAPWVGSIYPHKASPGAFFFLGKAAAPSPTRLAATTPTREFAAVLSSSNSTARSLNEFPVRGIDVSHNNGEIDWKKVKGSGIGFAYVKAVQGATLADPRLRANLEELHLMEIPHGVYLTYDFCKKPDEQVDNLLRVLPSGEDILPTALDLEWYEGGGSSWIGTQSACATTNLAITQDKILRVLQRLTAAYGKPPVIYLPSRAQKYLDKRFDTYPKWVSDVSPASRKGAKPNAGNWTIWQYDYQGKVDGIRGPVDLNVFSGDAKAFAIFKAGGLDKSN